MKFKQELMINRPRNEVWMAFTHAEYLKKWQPTLIRVELVNGEPGQEGAVSRLTYREREREFTLVENINRCIQPDQFDVTYENEFTSNPMKNKFIEQGEIETLWIVEAEYKFKTLLMKILGPGMKKNYVARTLGDMERFKEMVESQG